jgi:CheY-like chemotaxis protein
VLTGKPAHFSLPSTPYLQHFPDCRSPKNRLFLFPASQKVLVGTVGIFMRNGSSTVHSESLNVGRTPSTDFGPISRSPLAPPSASLPQHKKLLWVDDSENMLSLYKSIFESFGFEIWATSSPHDALDAGCLSAIDLAILDYEMPELNGSQLASIIKNRHPQMPVILYSGSLCIPNQANDWVDAICSKGGPRGELLSTIQRLTSRPANSSLAAASQM